MLPLGLRNNNPGNIEDGPFAQGLPGYAGSDGRFARFASVDHGYNAMTSLYNSGGYKNLNTISDIISRWAPTSDGNDVGAYSGFVSKRMGIGPNSPLNKNDPAQMRALAQAQAEYENGRAVPQTGGVAMDQGLYAPQQQQPQQSPGPDWGGMLSGIGAGLVTAVNPGAGAQLQGQFNEQMLKNRPQLVDGGTDPLSGKKRWMLYDPRSQTFSNPVQGAKALSAANGGSYPEPDTDTFNKAMDQFSRGEIKAEDVRKAVPPMVHEYAKALVEGKEDPRFLGARAGALRPYAEMYAHVLDPNFSVNQITERQGVARSLGNSSPTQLGGQFQSANTLMNHTALLDKDIDNLEKLGVTGKYGPLNKLLQFGTSNIPGLVDEKVQSAISSFNKHKQAVAGELVRLTRGANGSLQEVQDWKNGLDSSDSIASLRSGTNAVIDLMHGRIQSGVDRVNNAFGQGKTVDDYLSGPAKAAYSKITGAADQYTPDAPAQSAPAQQQQSQMPKVGEVRKGYRYKGGNPADPASWEK